MAQSLFNIFGDHITSQAVKNVTRQPLSSSVGNENLGKSIKNVSAGSLKPNEPVKNNQPMKKFGESKKSFLSNTGKAIQTPERQVFTPRAVNVGSMIYSEKDKDSKDCDYQFEAVEFTKPTFKFDNIHTDMFDFLSPEPAIIEAVSPPNTPPPTTRRPSMEFNYSYQDDFFKDDFSNQSLPDDDDLGLPSIY